MPTCAPQAIAWDQAAALLTFSLTPALLAATAHAVPPGVTGALVWVPCPAQTASPTPAVHPVLMVQAPSMSRQAARVTIVPDLPAHDPLRHHMALVLQAAVAAEGGADRLSPRSWPMRSRSTSSDAMPPLGPSCPRRPAGSRRTSCDVRSRISRTIWSTPYPWSSLPPWRR